MAVGRHVTMNSQNNYAKLVGLGNLTISTIALSYVSFAPSCLQAHLYIVAMTKEHRSETMDSLLATRSRRIDVSQGQKCRNEKKNEKRKGQGQILTHEPSYHSGEHL